MILKEHRTRSKFAVSMSSLSLFVIGLMLAMIYFLNPRGTLDATGTRVTVTVFVVLSVASLGIVIWSNREVPDWRCGGGIITGAAILLAGIVAYTAAAIWPNSGDEYTYLYQADTLLRGRFYNPASPAPGLFDFYWIGMHDGKSAGQYAPGWPAFLAIFRALHIHQLANPVLVGLLGWFLSASLKRLEVRSETRLPLLAMVLLCPFTIFNGASLFSHILASVATAGICYFQIQDDVDPSFWRKASIGALMSVLLVTRTDAFLIVAAVFAIDRLAVRRLNVLSDAVAFLLGALPISAVWLVYNWRVTGNPLLITMLWAFPEQQTFGISDLRFALRIAVNMAALLLVFAGVVPTLLYAAAIYSRLQRRSFRFYDLLLPAAVLFFLFYPHSPGHQYGPRYWYFAWPSIVLTIGPEFSTAGGVVRIIGRRLSVTSLANKQLYVFAGFTIGFAMFLRMYIDERRSLYTVQVPETPAIVLVANSPFDLIPWQIHPFWVGAMELTRNGLDYDSKVLYGRDKPDFVKVACSMGGYHVFRWRGPGKFLEKVDCVAL
jgi:hypothetical protein